MTALAKHCQIVLAQAQKKHYVITEHTEWTKELDREASRLFQEGRPGKEVAKRLGVTFQALRQRRKYLEATKDKRRQMVEMWNQVKSFSAVGRAFGVHKNTVKKAVELA